MISLRLALSLTLLVSFAHGCANKSGGSPESCPQPSGPSCLDRLGAWCSSAGIRGSAEAVATLDAGTLVACPDDPNSILRPASAVFVDAGPLDDAGVPFGCPRLGAIPTNSSLFATDAGTLSGTTCCYPVASTPCD
jgi:hypothetical protein